MDDEKQVNKPGGFLHLLDWHSKSRKKLFSSRQDKSKRKGFDGNSSVTSLHMIDDDVSIAGSSIRESCGYSCASSVTDEDFTGNKAPSVVARLMGLDSMPKSNSLEVSSTPCSEKSSCNKCRDLNRDQVQFLHCSSHDFTNGIEPKFTKVIEKFKTETLPPKSAKTIPITQHKLLSPIKKKNFIPTRDTDQIIQAAACMMKQMSNSSYRAKLSYMGVSSAPLKVKNLKQKAQTAQKTEFSSQRIDDSAAKAARNVKGTSSLVDSGSFCQGKSISLALQAKNNVLKRERQNVNNGSLLISQNEVSSGQSVGKKCGVKKPLSQNGLNALRPNNQKQNAVVLRQNTAPNCSLQVEKDSKARKESTGRSSSSKVTSSKRKSELKEEKEKELPSSTLKTARNKQLVDPNHSSEGNQSAQRKRKSKSGKENIQFNHSDDIQVSCDEGSAMMGTDVVSFTFSTPMSRSGTGSRKDTETAETCSIISDDTKTRKPLLVSYDSGALKSLEQADLSTLRSSFDQMLKKLNINMELPQRNREEIVELVEPCLADFKSSAVREDKRTEVEFMDHLQGQPGSSYVVECYQGSSLHSLKEVNTFKSSPRSQVQKPCVHEQDRNSCDQLFPTPVSVLEFSSDTERCDSAFTSDNISTGDSASSSCPGTMVNKQETTTASSWDLDYVKEILSDIEPMFKDYALGRTCEALNPHLFYQIECKRLCSNTGGLISRITRRLWFDCVSECSSLRCRQHVGGGWQLWDKGLKMVHRNDELAEDIHNEISGWSAMGDVAADELIDRDMNSKHGSWLSHETDKYEIGMQIETSILDSLIDEEIANVLVL